LLTGIVNFGTELKTIFQVKIYRELKDFRAVNPVVTIGTFDGVHLGHRKIIDRLRNIAAEIGGESVIFTFDPHPRKVVSPQESNLRLLTTLDEKAELLGQSGIDHLIIYPFTAEFANVGYEQFVEEILVGQVHTRYLVVGYDHRFGKDRQGGFEFLKKCADRHEFAIEQLDALFMNESGVSSTKIRNAIQRGDFETANAYLGYSFSLHGTVVQGQQLGRKIQYPTANIEASDPDKIIPGYGFYAVKVKINGKLYSGMLNIGNRPTVNQNADRRSIEVHIFDFEDDLYGQSVEIVFFKKLRDERKFGSLDELKDQLARDKQSAIAFLASLPDCS
jgi:riboflavin kinase/FMN adenylyltransferase